MAVLEPRRRAILRVLDERGGLPVGELAQDFEVSRPAISQHLAVLKDAGLVAVTTEHGRNTYRVVPGRLAEARAEVGRLAGELPGPGGPDLAIEAHVAAARDVTFAAAATAAGQAAWLGRAQADAEAGAPFRVDLGGDAAAGTYATVDPPSHLAFGWGQEGGGPMPPDSSRVDLRFTEHGEGTLVRLEHRGLPREAHAAHLASWAHHLARLAQAAEAAAARR
jgi:DNA-binding transcriptional ArsR family regulator